MSNATPTPEGPAASAIPNWVYALAIGVPVAAALAYILFADSDLDNKKVNKSKPKAEAARPAEERKEKEVEVENCPETEEEVVPTEPLEKATAAKNKGLQFYSLFRGEAARYPTNSGKC